jgi:hypothetical protein
MRLELVDSDGTPRYEDGTVDDCENGKGPKEETVGTSADVRGEVEPA